MSRRSVLWVLVVATARAKRRNPPQKPLVARTYTTATVDALGAEAAADVRVAFDDGCRTLAGDACAGPTPRTNGTEPVTLVLIKATRDCGANGLWHFLNRCVTAAARAAAQRRAALAFVAHDGEPPEEPCRLAPLAERWRPFLEALFADGVYASLACYRRAHPSARTYREVAVVAATPAPQTVPEYFRDVGFAAFGVPPPTDVVGVFSRVVEKRSTVGAHLRREDREGTLRAHRTLRNASVLEAAFRRAGFGVDHCCDFRAPDATRRAIQKVSRADVVVGMHGAAFAHLTWHKPGAVVVELFSHKMAGLWFYRSHTRRYGSVFVGPRTNGRSPHMDAATADRDAGAARRPSLRRAAPLARTGGAGSTWTPRRFWVASGVRPGFTAS